MKTAELHQLMKDRGRVTLGHVRSLFPLEPPPKALVPL